jgi:uncharacterized protein DUF2782
MPAYARVLGFALTVAAAAAQAQDPGPTLPPVQPPPDIDAAAATPAPMPAANAPVVPLANSDDEARAAAAAEAKASAERAKALASPTISTTSAEPGKPLDSPGLPPDVQKAAEATELPVVTVRQNGNERVEEYRKRGILYFVRVVPESGPTRLYVDRRTDVPPDIRQLSAPSGHVEPVYFKLAEWK